MQCFTEVVEESVDVQFAQVVEERMNVAIREDCERRHDERLDGRVEVVGLC